MGLPEAAGGRGVIPQRLPPSQGRGRPLAIDPAALRPASCGVQHRPRIAVIGKSRSILTWLDDTLDGFERCGTAPVAISFQADTVAERLSQKRGEGKEMRN